MAEDHVTDRLVADGHVKITDTIDHQISAGRGSFLNFGTLAGARFLIAFFGVVVHRDSKCRALSLTCLSGVWVGLEEQEGVVDQFTQCLSSLLWPVDVQRCSSRVSGCVVGASCALF